MPPSPIWTVTLDAPSLVPGWKAMGLAQVYREVASNLRRPYDHSANHGRGIPESPWNQLDTILATRWSGVSDRPIGDS